MHRQSAGDTELKVVARPAAVQPGTATVAVRLAFAKPTTYPVGTPVQVEIEAETHKGVVLVPHRASCTRARRPPCSSSMATRRQRRAVKTGVEDDEHVEIISGVKPGEMVITSAARTVCPTAPRSRCRRATDGTQRSERRRSRAARHSRAALLVTRRAGRRRRHRRVRAAQQHLPAARVPAHRDHRAQRHAAAAVDDADRHAADRDRR